tara:strand:+ start:363 stop:716 length:354 start_codon:yes stop_codon:yes gene_type:complete
MKNKIKTYVFGIDGVICTKANKYEDANPIIERIKKINLLYDEGNKIYFHTSRGMSETNNNGSMAWPQFYRFTRNQLRLWGVKYHRLFLGKPAGDLYINYNLEDFKIFFNDAIENKVK